MRFAESSETILARLGALRDADAPTHGGQRPPWVGGVVVCG